MQVTVKVAVIALLSLPAGAIAGEKKQAPARSLADDAAFLTEKSGKLGWTTDDIWLTSDQGKVKFTGQLLIAFVAEKDKAKGGLSISLKTARGNVGETGLATFELVEEKGKRSVLLRRAPKEQYTLEYSIDGDALQIKGASNVQWVFNTPWFVDFTKATPFRAGNAASRLSADEQAAVEAIKKMGNYVTVDDTRPSGTVTTVLLVKHPMTEAFKLVKKLKNLKTLDLSCEDEIKDAMLKEMLKELKDIRGLQELALSEAYHITDAGLKELKELKNLRRLGIYNNDRITDAGLKELTRLTELRYLRLECTQVTDTGLKELKDLPNLQELWIERTKASEAGVQELQKARPDLKIHR